MCGRFTLTVDPAEMGAAFRNYNFPSQFVPRFNIAPSQPILAIPNDGNNKADFFIWGLIPSWAKDPTIGNRLINARGETLAEKPSFRGGYKYKRCLVLADGFYEWKKTPGTKAKVPHFIHMKTRKPFAFAGLWSEWHSPDGSQIRSCTIVTTQPNPIMAAIHDRMPVIIDPDDYQRWIDPAAQSPDSLQPLIKPYPADEMTAHPVSTLVNNPKNDRAECVVPA
ncbi:MAG: SOS response-associated peptidase [Anaerolineae bacterium]|nr:SOS response-associated peptidase [Anaerolineae bacterium]MDK1080517.1 SOS response-associated peptidase [Anaerolineae bacterium]MDK1118212.1 SOS response-associated peptidase [Anaerolineae bacterium]